MPQTVLCADIGTTSLKAALITSDGTTVATARRQFFLCYTDHAAKEWLPALKEAAEQIHSQPGVPEPDAVCISGNGPTLVSFSGETLLWNENAPAVNTASLFIPRILAFKNKYPQVWNKTPFLLSGPEFLIWQLTDRTCTILPEKRFAQAYWNNQELAKAGLNKTEAAKLPDFLYPGQCVGTITRTSAALICTGTTGIKEGTPVYCGAPDFVSALVGTATLRPGAICDRAGSSEGINMCTDVPLKDSGIRTLPSVTGGLWNSSVLIPESGSRFEAFRQKIERETGHPVKLSELTQMLINEDGTKPSLEQGKYLLIQTALQAKDALEKLRTAAKGTLTVPANEMTVTGGQAKNAAWLQMKADITGMKINVPECADAELTGDAVFAFTGMNLFVSIEEAVAALCRIRKTYTPSE